MNKLSKCVLSGLTFVAIMSFGTASAQTPSVVHKDMFGNDCVREGMTSDGLTPAYAVINFQNTCSLDFTIEWVVDGVFKGNTGIVGFKESQITVLRTDIPKMAWGLYAAGEL